MKITYIHQHFKRPDQAGGTRSWEFARRLASDGHAVTMICGGPERATYTEAGFTVVQLPVRYANAMAPWRRLVAFARFMQLATTATYADRGDVVLASSTPLTVAVPALVSTRLRRSAFVLEVRDLWPEAPVALGYLRSRPVIGLALRLERTAYQRARRVIALSPGMAAGVSRVVPGKQVDVVPNACDIELFDLSPADRATVREREAWGDDRVLVYAGSLGAIYDVPWLADLALAARRQGLRVVVVGDGSELPAARARLRDSGIDPDEVFVGPRSKVEVAGLVAAADAVVSSVVDAPVLEPASINKVFDGLAAARPVVFNHRGWLTDLVTAEGAGLYVGDVDADTAVRRVLDLLTDDLRYRRAVDRARAVASEHFARDTLYGTFRDVLTDAGRVR
jgi:glycosyltransferase involved in cell wall biosynthesis